MGRPWKRVTQCHAPAAGVCASMRIFRTLIGSLTESTIVIPEASRLLLDSLYALNMLVFTAPHRRDTVSSESAMRAPLGRSFSLHVR